MKRYGATVTICFDAEDDEDARDVIGWLDENGGEVAIMGSYGRLALVWANEPYDPVAIDALDALVAEGVVDEPGEIPACGPAGGRG